MTLRGRLLSDDWIDDGPLRRVGVGPGPGQERTFGIPKPASSPGRAADSRLKRQPVTTPVHGTLESGISGEDSELTARGISDSFQLDADIEPRSY